MIDNPDRIAAVMKDYHGRDVTLYNTAFLMNIVEARRAACGLSRDALYCERLIEDITESDIFYDSLHITFSRFFREPLTYAMLEQIVFPEICSRKAGNSEIRIWSAGCAGGQEAYSMAMLLLDLTQDTGREIRFRIFATDMDEKALEAGKTGIYHRDAAANIQSGRLDRYFIEHGGFYTANNALRRNVCFSAYNLLDESSAHPPESIFGDFDLVICSNLLIYYTPRYQQIILEKLQKSLAPYGYLITGEAEKSLVGNVLKQQMITHAAAIFKTGKGKGILS